MSWKRNLIGITTGAVFFLAAMSCGMSKKSSSSTHEYLPSVGDIVGDSTIDDTSFHRCYPDDYILQYFNRSNGFRYKGEKKKLNAIFDMEYTPVKKKEQSGYIRIRFVVNCKGESGQFRVLTSDENFEPKEFHPKVVNQLLKITKELDGWYVVKDSSNEGRDYYQYLIFKMEEGSIKEIMP